ncbi:hypothetical protein OG746_36385 [Streptomyces sp. NBC_01016]|uniref:DUF6907 domain-containing protein n=1 Tax=Streptomyces sp. NBC_01016 TaxID=2903720 RepID=UPI002254E846|nr:hypothetical protein [Streptomyces sp. NBC_01016]MCX4834212.1 hypothetical protein [Streptomyces sp. NBC_01016]
MMHSAHEEKAPFRCPNWCASHNDEERRTGEEIDDILHMAKTADVLPDPDDARGTPSWDGFTVTLCAETNEDGSPRPGRLEIVIDQAHYYVKTPHAARRLEDDLESVLHAVRDWRGIMEVEQSLAH